MRLKSRGKIRGWTARREAERDVFQKKRIDTGDRIQYAVSIVSWN